MATVPDVTGIRGDSVAGVKACGYGPYAADITLVQTPEPGSMLLLATGLGGVMAAAPRLRRKGLPQP